MVFVRKVEQVMHKPGYRHVEPFSRSEAAEEAMDRVVLLFMIPDGISVSVLLVELDRG